jgi:hypothetical protein
LKVTFVGPIFSSDVALTLKSIYCPDATVDVIPAPVVAKSILLLLSILRDSRV